MRISKESYDTFFHGFKIADCVVRSKDILYLVLLEDYTFRPDWDEDSEPPDNSDLGTRVVSQFLDEPESESWSCTELEDFEYLLAGVSVVPTEQFVGVDMDGEVYVLGSGEDEIELPVTSFYGEENGVNRGTISKCRTIDETLFLCGMGRTVSHREGKNKWFSHTHSIPYDDEKSQGFDHGFEDIDGFSKDDIYCVGGRGDVWHFNGKKWSQIHFPSNMLLHSLCCGGDGFVYVSGQGGTTFKGRDDRWTRIFTEEMTIPFRDMVWYENKVWCTSDYGIWVIEDDKLKVPDVESFVLDSCGNLSTADGLLLAAGYGGVSYKLDGKWVQIL